MTDDEYNDLSREAKSIIDRIIEDKPPGLIKLMVNNSNPAILLDKFLNSKMSNGQIVYIFIESMACGNKLLIQFIYTLLAVTFHRIQQDLGLLK